MNVEAVYWWLTDIALLFSFSAAHTTLVTEIPHYFPKLLWWLATNATFPNHAGIMPNSRPKAKIDII
jgi:hypothetical protein